jgi:hypothetical protein
MLTPTKQAISEKLLASNSRFIVECEDDVRAAGRMPLLRYNPRRTEIEVFK